jgi:hypothetical protein
MDVEKTIEFILQQQAQVEVHLAAISDRLDRTGARLDRAVRLGIREARAERAKRRELDAKTNRRATEFDEKITQLAAAQLVTEEKLQRFIDAQRGGGNGKP